MQVEAIDDAVAIYAGGLQSCAERANGSLWPPTQLLPTVTSIALGDLHGCAVDADHNAWCWGNNDANQVKLG